MLESTIQNYSEYTSYLSENTQQGLASLVLENMIPSDELMQNLVLRDTGKITSEEFFKRELERMSVPTEMQVERRIYMLHRAHDTVQPPRNNVPLWTQDEAIAFECAKEVIGDLMGICSGKIAEEEASSHPDLEKIKKLGAERSALFDERAHLYLKDSFAIKRLNIEYGKKVRTYRENKKTERLNGNSST